MTAERRREMNVYKELAKDVEKRVKKNKKSTPARPVTLNIVKNTLENRLACEDESETERWSPLQVDSLSDLRLQMNADSDSAQDTPDTVTASPKFCRQGSYTVLESKGRKTWDLRQAKEQWSSVVPSSYRVPFDSSEPASVPSVREQLSSLTDMMIAMKLKHEQQRRDLEMQQAAEEEEYEKLFTFKQRQILQFVGGPVSLPNSFRVQDSVQDTDIDGSFFDDGGKGPEDSWSCSSVMSNEPVKEPPREYSSPERLKRNQVNFFMF